MEIFTLILGVLFILFILYCKKYHDKSVLATKLPGPITVPLLGNAILFAGLNPPQLLKKLEDIVKEYGTVIRIMIGHQVQIMLTDPKDAEIILGSQTLIDKSNEYDFIAAWLGTGLLISTGQKWFSRRKVITPTFHFKILEQFVEVFDKHSETFVKNLAKFNGQAVDVFPLVTLCALDNICETSMGAKVDAQINSNSIYVRAVKEMSGILAARNFNIILRIDFLFYLSSYGRRQKKVLKILHDFTDSVILARREELLQSKQLPKESNEDDIGIKKKMALLDVLLQSTIDGKPLSNLDIREEVDTFMFEGHDTTTSAIAFCLYNLAKNPECQQKAFDEVRNVIGDDKTKAVTQTDLNNLNYLELVIKETLRLYPSVPFFARKMPENVNLNGKIIPKDSCVAVGPFFMGRSEKLWKNAEQFIPERFDVDNNKYHPYAHVPFSAGPRNCIGQKFAILEMKSTISKVLRNLELSVAPNYEPILIAELILRPENGVILIPSERKY